MRAFVLSDDGSLRDRDSVLRIVIAVDRLSSERSRRLSLLWCLRSRESPRVLTRSLLSPRIVLLRSTLIRRLSRLSLLSRMSDFRISIEARLVGFPLSPREAVRDFSCPPNIAAADETLFGTTSSFF